MCWGLSSQFHLQIKDLESLTMPAISNLLCLSAQMWLSRSMVHWSLNGCITSWCGKTQVQIFTENLTILHLVWIDFSVIVYLHNLILWNPLQFLSKINSRKNFLLVHLFLHIFSFLKSLEVLFVGPLMPLFWTSGDVFSGFQSQSGQPYSPHLFRH